MNHSKCFVLAVHIDSHGIMYYCIYSSDRLTVKGVEGIVERVYLRYTILRGLPPNEGVEVRKSIVHTLSFYSTFSDTQMYDVVSDTKLGLHHKRCDIGAESRARNRSER